MDALGQSARGAAAMLARSDSDQRDGALQRSATVIRENVSEILAANSKDMRSAESRGLSSAMLDRLMLDEERVESMARGLEAVVALQDMRFETLPFFVGK